jgi:hypothetical protein
VETRTEKESDKFNIYTEVGDSGLKRTSGWINEEFLPQLKTPRQRNIVYTEMKENDSIIASFLFIIEMLIRNVEWTVKPFSKNPKDVEAAEFIESCLSDMEKPFEDVISEILSMLPYGWSVLEKIFKIRRGANQDPKYNSKYDDGLISWRKLPLRSQDSLERWVFNEAGDAVRMIQRRPVDQMLVEIPLDKTLHFRTTIYKNNPEGRSILRSAYKDYYFKKNIQSVEGIGIERDLAGLPVMYIPQEVMSDSSKFNSYKNIVRNIRRDEQEGLILPSDTDMQGNRYFDFQLLSSSGSRQFNTSEIIDRYDKRIASTVAADFILLGQSNVGSFALASDKTNMFANAIGGWLKTISSIFNRHGIDELLKLNNMEGQCELVYGDIEKDDIERLARIVETMARSGAAVGNEQFNAVFESAGIPTIKEEDEMSNGFRPEAEEEKESYEEDKEDSGSEEEGEAEETENENSRKG